MSRRTHALIVEPPEPAGGYAVAALIGSVLVVALVVGGATLAGRTASPLTWFLSRAAGFVLYGLLWLSLVTGLGLGTHRLDRVASRGLQLSLHAFATQLAYGFLSLHMLALLADAHQPLSARAALLPFVSNWLEPWTGLGIIAAWLLVVIAVSSGLRKRLGYPAWRALHLLAFPLYALALAHGVRAGSSSNQSWAQAFYLFTAAVAVGLLGYRLLRVGAKDSPGRADAMGAPVFDRLRGW
ncbi:MAG: ferric reductase-like transmembrane domain-containing protein [Thermomicrobiales bacterium]|nr:ferric reductase-like transmembrane domain-containing protein [Thermomicrobiales bacterium]